MTQSSAFRAWARLSSYLNYAVLLGISAAGLVGLYHLRDPAQIAMMGGLGIILTGPIGIWRWSWFGFHLLRSRIYLHWVFPRWRRRANVIPLSELPTACLVVPTFREKPWITERVFRAIAREAKCLSKPTIVVVVTTKEENAAILEIIKSEDPELQFIQLVQMLDPGGGKRKALAEGLRALARLNPPEDTIVGLMDGDAEITPGALSKCLPLFRLFPKVGGMTTDEESVVVGSYLFSEWLQLRFAQRHLYMCSHSLSRKVLCLTGRFSLFRSKAALDPSFADLLENDTLNDWLWGQFNFLSGDDKSTWYWVLKRGYDMIYVPDVMVYTIETISGSLYDRVYQNMRRWFGNMLRNGNRAIALGPRRTGYFTWYCLVDQRLSIWTSLFAPGLLLIYLFQANWFAAALVISWLAFTRPLSLLLFSSGRDENLKPIHIILDLLSQWSSALIKIWTQMNLAQQKWSNRGNQSRSIAGSPWKRRIKYSTSRFLWVSQMFSFVVLLLCLSQVLNPLRDIPDFWSDRQLIAQASPTEIVEASDRGVIPNDGRDDSKQLQALINGLPSDGEVQINLPFGEIDLLQPLEINRSNTTLKGQGMGRTILQAHFSRKLGEAVILIRPHHAESPVAKSLNKVKNIQLSNFTLVQMQPQTATAVNGIVLENVVDARLKKLDLDRSGHRALIRRHTEDVKLEYVSL